jgi:hypothetical protein
MACYRDSFTFNRKTYWKNMLDTKCAFNLSLERMLETFFVPVNIWLLKVEIRTETHADPHEVSIFSPDLFAKIEKCPHILLKLPIVKFHDNPLNGYRVLSRVRTDR